MRQNVKITKKDLKQDKFTTTMLLAKDYVMNNWVYFVGGGVALLLIVFGITFLKQENEHKTLQAAQIYNRAMNQYLSKSYQQAIVDFKLVSDDYGSTPYAEEAMFNLANAYFASKNYTEAQTAFEEYLKKYGGKDKYFTTSAIAGVAECLASLGNPQQAADKYREAAEKYPDFKLDGMYYVRAMQYYAKSGNLESAKVIYAKISKKYKNTSYYQDASLIAGENNIEL